MRHARILVVLIQTLAAVAALCFSVAWAQQAPKAPLSTGPQAPAQPLAPLPSGSNGSAGSGAAGGSVAQDVAQPEPSTQVQPDTHALASAEILGLGSLRRLTRIFDPALQFSELAETGIVAGQTVSVSSVGGTLDVERRWRRYHTSPPTIMACATCLITTAASRRKYPWGGGHCGCATMCCIHGDPVLAVYSQVGLHWRARMVPWTASSDLWLPVERSRRPLHGSSPIPHWAKSIMRTADGQR